MCAAYTGLPIRCTFCIYETSLPSKWWTVDFRLNQATKVILVNNGLREVCDIHAERFKMVDLTEEQQKTTMVFLVRKDQLFDLLHHPRGLIRFGLSKREKEAYIVATPKFTVIEVNE